MAKDGLQQHLDHGQYGTPRINPDEQRKYLGTFRERCFLSMTIKEMKNQQDQNSLIKEFSKHPEGKLLINGDVPAPLQQIFIKLASKHAVDFTIVNDATAESEESIGVLLTTDHAVNEEIIDVEAKYPTEESKEDSAKKEEPKKKSFLGRLFE